MFRTDTSFYTDAVINKTSSDKNVQHLRLSAIHICLAYLVKLNQADDVTAQCPWNEIYTLFFDSLVICWMDCGVQVETLV